MPEQLLVAAVLAAALVVSTAVLAFDVRRQRALRERATLRLLTATVPQLTEDDVAYRIGVAGVPRPRHLALIAAPRRAARPTAEGDRPPGTGSGLRPTFAVARTALVVCAAVLVVATIASRTGQAAPASAAPAPVATLVAASAEATPAPATARRDAEAARRTPPSSAPLAMR